MPSTLTDLTELSLKDLPGRDSPGMTRNIDRILRRVDRPGASISGYNGAGGTEQADAAAAAEVVVELPEPATGEQAAAPDRPGSTGDVL